MATKPHVPVSVLLAIILLILTAFLVMFIQIVLLNGVMNERQATTALGVTLGCQVLTIILGAMFARWLTRLLITRFNWSGGLAVFIPLLLILILGAGAGFLSILGGLFVSGIQ